MAQKPLTVLVANPHSVARAGVKAVLARERCKVIEVSTGREAVRLALKCRPHVAILDTQFEDLHGHLVAHQINNAGYGTKVMLLTADEDNDSIERAMEMSVHGYLCESSPIEQLPEAVRALSAGLHWFDEKVQRHLAEHAHVPGYAKRNPLSPREDEIVRMVAQGKQNKEIASALNLSPKTVDRHRQNIMEKLGRHETVGIVHYAIKRKIVYAT